MVKFGKALISVQTDSQDLFDPLSAYLREHRVESDDFDAEIELNLKKILSPIPTYARLALRYYAVKVFYLEGRVYFTDFRSFLTLEPGGKKLIGYVSPETLEESGIHFFTHTFFTLALFELLRHQGFFFLHSSALISPEKKPCLFPAGGGEGKSTLALHLIHQGYRFISDDIVFLSRASGRVTVSGFKKLSHLSLEAMKRFPELAQLKHAPSLDGKGKKIVDLDRVYPGQRADQAGGKFLLIFPKRVDNGNSRLQPLSSLEGFKLLLSQSPLVFIEPALAKEHMGILRDLIGSSRLWLLESGKDWIEDPMVLKNLIGRAGQGRGKE